MIKVEVDNIVNGRSFMGSFEDLEAANIWIDRQVQKCSWGKPTRQVKESEMSEIEKTRVLTKEKDESGEWICSVKADYEIRIYQDQDYGIKRAAEYPSWSEVMEALIENMEMRPAKLEQIKRTREQVRAKYPKNEKELLEKR